MANKRMFNIKIVDSDAFLDMPLSTQCLYFHLNMRADDDGFIGNPKKIMRMVGCSEDDLKLLIAKRFVLTFENGVIVIKHWKMHNCIQTDRYTPTVYMDEKNMLFIKQNKSYTLDEEKKYIPVSKTETKRNQNGNKMETNRIQSVYTDIDIDKDIDIDQEKDKDKSKIKSIYCVELSETPQRQPPPKTDKKSETIEVEPVPSGYKIILLDKSFYEIPLEKLNFWKESYPAVDVEQEIRNMEAWADANPIKRKTRNGVVRFITNWLKREQDKGGSYQRGNSQKGTAFNAFDYIQKQISGGSENDYTGTGF